jgi:hypothetical protein
VVAILKVRSYEKRAKRLLPEAVRMEMENAIASAPALHPVVQGAGGVRKARWSRPGSGKSGGVRVIFYFHVAANEMWFLDIYAKNEKDNISNDDKKAYRKIIEGVARPN